MLWFKGHVLIWHFSFVAGRTVFRADHRATVQPPPAGSGSGRGSSSGPGGVPPTEQLAALTVSGAAAAAAGGVGGGSVVGTISSGGGGVAAVSGGAPSGGSGQLGRGSTRGRREDVGTILRTRPDHIESKSGTKGLPVALGSNYFRLTRRPDWVVHHYNVQFSPEEDHIKVKRRIMFNLEERLGPHIFDGASMFSLRRPSPEIEGDFTSERWSIRDGQKITVMQLWKYLITFSSVQCV